MMRSLRFVVLMLILVFGVGVAAVAAAPVAVSSSLSFVWVRAAPSSYAQAVYTVYPTAYATLETTGNTHWDGTQTWAEVTVIGNAGIRGWVEQGSVVGSTPPVAQPPATYWPQTVQPQVYYTPYYGGWQTYSVPWNQNVQIHYPWQVPYTNPYAGWDVPQG